MKCEYCGEETRRGDVENHLKQCRSKLIPCPNGCKDEKKKEVKQIEKMNLDSHIKNECPKRASECELCGEKGTFQHITQVHVKICPNVVIDCLNVQCNRRLQRRLLDEHVDNECEYTKVLCEICGIYVEKKNLDMHRQTDIHTLHGKATRATADRVKLQQEAKANLDKLRAEVKKEITEIKREADKATANGIELTYWLLIITGVVCAVLAAVVLRAPESPPNSSHMTSIQSLDDSLATLETQVAELKKQLAAKEKASPSVEMAEKVAALEKQLTAIKKSITRNENYGRESSSAGEAAYSNKKSITRNDKNGRESSSTGEAAYSTEKSITRNDKNGRESNSIGEAAYSNAKSITRNDKNG